MSTTVYTSKLDGITADRTQPVRGMERRNSEASVHLERRTDAES